MKDNELLLIYFHLQVPETPIWLISKRKNEKALKSLQWLRGWVSPESVFDEYESLQKYNDISRTCEKCARQFVECGHTETVKDKLKQFSRKRILKPFILVTMLEFFSQFCGVVSWRPYIIQILNAYAIQVDPNLTTVVMSLFGFAARTCLLSIIKIAGKRRIYLVSSAVTIICCFGLSQSFMK